jgi:hypothetical protein
MVIAALICFATLLVAWLFAPERAVTAIPIEPAAASELSEEARRVLATAA